MMIVPEDNGVVIEVTDYDVIQRLRDLVDGKVVEECPECGGVGDVRTAESDYGTCPVCEGECFVRWILTPVPESKWACVEPLDPSERRK